MDPFEEFEFKPLTEGLGFHKEKNPDLTRSEPAKFVTQEKRHSQAESVSRLINSIPNFDNPSEQSRKTIGDLAQARTDNLLTQPLPRSQSNLTASTSPTTAFKSPKYKNTDAPILEPIVSPTTTPPTAPIGEKTKGLSFDETVTRSRISAAPLLSANNTLIEEVPTAWISTLFDTLVVTGLVCLFTGVTVAVTGANIRLVLANATTDFATQMSLVLLVFSVIQMYMILSRSFFGATLGEWAFDFKVGNNLQQKSVLYPVQVTLRSLIISATGFVLIPILSHLFGRDIAGAISGAKRYKN